MVKKRDEERIVRDNTGGGRMQGTKRKARRKDKKAQGIKVSGCGEVRLPSYSSGSRLLMLVTVSINCFIPSPRFLGLPNSSNRCLTASFRPLLDGFVSSRPGQRDGCSRKDGRASPARESCKSPRMIANHSPGRAQILSLQESVFQVGLMVSVFPRVVDYDSVDRIS